MGRRPPHLALNPPYCFGLFFPFGGLKGVRWPFEPPHLVPSPPYLVWLVSFCFLLDFSFLEEEEEEEEILFAPWRRAFLLFTFQCLPLFFPRFFFLTPSPFFFFLLTLTPCISLLFYLFPCFLFRVLFPCFCFTKRTSSNYLIGHFAHQHLSVLGFPVLFCHSKSFFIFVFRSL